MAFGRPCVDAGSHRLSHERHTVLTNHPIVFDGHLTYPCSPFERGVVFHA